MIREYRVQIAYAAVGGHTVIMSYKITSSSLIGALQAALRYDSGAFETTIVGIRRVTITAGKIV